MPFNNGPGNPFMPTDWDHKQSLKDTYGGNTIFAAPRFGRSFKARENVAPATDAITIVDQHDEEMKNSIPAEDQDTGMRPPVEASQQRTNPNRQFQRNHSLPIQHQQGQAQLRKANPMVTAIAGSKAQAHQSSNFSSPASAQSAYLKYPSPPSIGASRQMAPTVVPYTQQKQAQQPQQQAQQDQQAQHPQQEAQQAQQQQQAQQRRRQQQQQQNHQPHQQSCQQPHMQPQPQQQQQLQQNQQRQQHANVSGDYQMYQARGHDQAKKSLSQAQSVRGAPQPSLSRHQSAAPLPPKTEEPSQKKRGRPSREEDELRIYGASAPITTFGSRHQARPFPELLHSTADGSGKLSASKAQSNEQGTSPTYDDPMQEVEAAVVGTPVTATSPEHGSVAVGFERQCQQNDTYSDSSDAQAKFLPAQKIAVEKDVKQRIRVRSRMTRRLQRAPRSQVHSEERDTRGELLVDIDNDGAGSADRVHYRSREALRLDEYGYLDEVDGVGRPSTATRSLQRFDVDSGIDIRVGQYGYPIPGQEYVNSSTPARLDMTGTGGFVGAAAQSQRLRFKDHEAIPPPIASETNANKAGRPISQQHPKDLRAGAVYDHDSFGTQLPKSSLNSSNALRQSSEQKDGNINSMSGHEIHEDGEVRSEYGESLGRVTDGHRPILVGAEVDDNGYVVDNKGNKVGDSTPMQNRKEYEGPTEEETVAAHDADIAKEIKPNESKHMHAMRRPRGPGGRFLTAKEESLNEECGRKKAQVPHTVADSRPQMSSIEGLEPTVTQRRHYIKTLPEAPLQQSQHLAPYGSFFPSNQVSPPDNGMFQYNNATDSWWDDFELANMEQPAAKPAGSPVSASAKFSKASPKRDMVALNEEPTVAACKGRARSFRNRPDGESEKPEDNENGVSDASHSAHDEKDFTKFNASSLGSLTGETSQVPRAEVKSNEKGQTGDLGPPKTIGGFSSRRFSSRYMESTQAPAPPILQEPTTYDRHINHGKLYLMLTTDSLTKH